MSMGTFDAEEYGRHEKKISSVDADSDDRRTNFKGHVDYTGDHSIEELLGQLKEMKAG